MPLDDGPTSQPKHADITTGARREHGPSTPAALLKLGGCASGSSATDASEIDR